MNNFPAMTEEQRQVLIGRLQIYIRTAETAIKAGLATKEDVFNLTVWKIALEALNAPPAPVLCSPAYHDEAKRLAELHGMSFVVFRHGEAPAVADPTRVTIGFTDKGLGHDTTGDEQ